MLPHFLVIPTRSNGSGLIAISKQPYLAQRLYCLTKMSAPDLLNVEFKEQQRKRRRLDDSQEAGRIYYSGTSNIESRQGEGAFAKAHCHELYQKFSSNSEFRTSSDLELELAPLPNDIVEQTDQEDVSSAAQVCFGIVSLRTVCSTAYCVF
jgi:hypothetical protein